MPEKPMLTALEARILGALMEKQRTTPDNYPLTLNGLVQACNQKTSRNPIMHLTSGEVGHSVNVMRDRDLIAAEFSGRAERYDQKLYRALGLDRKKQALLCVLMLRGAQTLGELRTHSSRMAEFGDLTEVKLVLDELVDREPPLVNRIPRAPGHREERYAQLLSENQAATAPASTHPQGEESTGEQSIEGLQKQVQQMREELDALWRLTGLEDEKP
ncbi:MAG: DUF480 domain-containing protein [Gammaproteobacteria bacterium]|nr:DUF480 domain-containing protein [Gammaproteobacteria bacterium]